MVFLRSTRPRGLFRRQGRADIGGRAMKITEMKAALCAALICAIFAPAAGFGQAASSAPPPTGFRGIELGMELSAVKQRLGADALFRYRGDPDVSLLPQSSQALIECEGTSFIRRAYFQFEKDRLFIMILVLDSERLDHFSLFSALSKKYGQPAALDPSQSVWLFDAVRLSLERPLTVKYVERKTFDELVKKGGAQEDFEQLSREKFIEQF